MQVVMHPVSQNGDRDGLNGCARLPRLAGNVYYQVPVGTLARDDAKDCPGAPSFPVHYKKSESQKQRNELE
jgi:hypothetical protein